MSGVAHTAEQQGHLLPMSNSCQVLWEDVGRKKKYLGISIGQSWLHTKNSEPAKEASCHFNLLFLLQVLYQIGVKDDAG